VAVKDQDVRERERETERERVFVVTLIKNNEIMKIMNHAFPSIN